MEHTNQVHYCTLEPLQGEEKTSPAVWACFFFPWCPRILPNQNMIPGIKWVCCVYGFERCHGIFWCPEEAVYSGGKLGYRTDCSWGWGFFLFWLNDGVGNVGYFQTIHWQPLRSHRTFLWVSLSNGRHRSPNVFGQRDVFLYVSAPRSAWQRKALSNSIIHVK